MRASALPPADRVASSPLPPSLTRTPRTVGQRQPVRALLILLVLASTSYRTYTSVRAMVAKSEEIAVPPSRSLHRVRLQYPTGLLLLDSDSSSSRDKHICVLQHNSLGLRPAFRRVKELCGVISSKECENIIRDGNAYAASNGGWTNSRHTAYSTTDIPVEVLYGEESHISEIVERIVLPEIAAFFDLDRDGLHILELFVVKYEGEQGAQSSLSAHVDGTPWSFVTALNDASMFDGGGTRFVGSGRTYKPTKAGGTVIFSGKNRHEGVEVTRGVRYVLAGFCDYVPSSSSEGPHAVFMKNYDSEYDGFAARDGVMTGDVLRGLYDSTGELHCIDDANTIHALLEKDVITGSSHVLILVERLLAAGDYSDDDDAVREALGDDDDRLIRDIIHNADQVLSIGELWRFDSQ